MRPWFPHRPVSLIAAVWLTACSDDATVEPVAEEPTEVTLDASATASAAPADTSATHPSDSISEPDAGAANISSSVTNLGASHHDAGAPDEQRDAGDAFPVASITLPPANGGLDYQLGGSYRTPANVGIVARDRTAQPEPGVYDICYVNGFQVQPGEQGNWDADLLLRDENGDVVIDEDWDEAILDVSTEDKRVRISEVVGGWIEGCRSDGFDAVEIDNLDTFSRSGGRITEEDAVAFVARLSRVAHAAGLAIAQKNAVELVPRRAEMGTDFVVAEECNAWSECDGYIASYGPHVLMVEYTREDFDVGCSLYGSEFSVVLRDRTLTTPGDDAYVYEGC